MTQYGVDYSRGRPDLACVIGSGKRFVMRYLAYLPNTKVISKTELQTIHAKGLGVVLNWEQAQGDMLKGKSAGQEHAKEALKQANALGAPKWVPIYFSCDVDITNGSQMAAVAAYLDGVASVIGKNRTGVYGEYSVMEALVPAHATFGWQTYAWSGGKISSHAHIMQYRNGVSLCGADVDLDRSLNDNYGVWFRESPTPKPPVPPLVKDHSVYIKLDGFSLPELHQGDDDSQFSGWDHVMRAQRMLNVASDGNYGPKTSAAVKARGFGDGKTINLAVWTNLYGLSRKG